MHLNKSASQLEIQVLKISMQNFMCPFNVLMLTCQCKVNIFWMIHINKLLNMLCKPFLTPHKVQWWYLTNFPIHMFKWCQITIHNKFVNIFKFCEEKAWYNFPLGIWTQIIFMKNKNNITIKSNEFSFPSRPKFVSIQQKSSRKKNYQNLWYYVKQKK